MVNNPLSGAGLATIPPLKHQNHCVLSDAHASIISEPEQLGARPCKKVGAGAWETWRPQTDEADPDEWTTHTPRTRSFKVSMVW